MIPPSSNEGPEADAALEAALAALPRADVGALTAAQHEAGLLTTFRKAHARQRSAERPWVLRAYDRAEPVLVAAVSVLYLASMGSRVLVWLGMFAW